jgi:phosphate starvation-inducible protein PhoH and related proteins
MGKRAARRANIKNTRQFFDDGHNTGLGGLDGSEGPEGSKGNVQPLFNGEKKYKKQRWTPMDDVPSDAVRDQKYRKNVTPRNDSQKEFFKALDINPLVFAIGPAGTGKTYVAVAKAVEALERGKVGRIVLSRPAVEAGENLGYLPGDMEEKLSPYLRPLYDALADRFSAKRLKAMIADDIIEIAPIAFMRGRTLNNAFVVLDEAQNCTYGQLKMLLTRLGWHSTMVVTGDPEQSDLLPGMSGLDDIARKLEPSENITSVRFTKADVVRHPLVAEMIALI